MKSCNPAIFIVGNFFNNRGGTPTTQAEELKKILENRGGKVIHASRHLHRVARFCDTLYSLLFFRRQYQIVNIQFYGGLALVLEGAASLLAKWLGKTIVFTLHGGAIPDKIKKYPKWYRRVLSRATMITCPSNYLIHHLSPLGLPLRLIENSLPLPAYQFQAKKSFGPRLLWMRSFHPIYNPAMALEVVSLLKKDYPELRLYMAGVDLGHFEETKTLVSKMGLEKEVIFPGYIDIEKKNLLAETCDIYLCTNRIDNTPVSLLEMMALGLPIVTTNIGGIPFMVQNNEALLVASEDAEAMADAVRQLITSPEIGQELVQRGLALVQRYDEAVVAKKWISLLQELCFNKFDAKSTKQMNDPN